MGDAGSSLTPLASTPCRAVVINVGTDEVAAVAVASARRTAGLPTLVVNCAPSAESRATWVALARELDCDVIERPLDNHGATLDRLCRGVPSEILLMLDSDAEVLDPEWATRMVNHFEHPRVFAAGFFQTAKWWNRNQAPGSVLNEERPWMPCVFVRTAHARAALDAGLSFRERDELNDFRFNARIAAHLAARLDDAVVPRSRIVDRLPATVRERARRSNLPWLHWARRPVHGVRPSYVHFDTGADVYRWCKERGWLFAGLPGGLRQGEVAHVGGYTRGLLGQGTPERDTGNVAAAAVRRLGEVYGVRWPAGVDETGVRATG